MFKLVLMKCIFILFFTFFLNSPIFSQEIIIPYREGSLWGICDENKTILIKPQFDKLEFEGSDYTKKYSYIITYKNGYKGLIIKGKEILKPKYTYIYKSDGLFTIISDEKNSSFDLIDDTGKSVFDQSFAYLLSSGRITSYMEMYHVMHHDFTESMFLFDLKSKKIVQYLYKNYYSISKNGRQKNREVYTFNIKKSKKDDLAHESWNFYKFPAEKTDFDLDANLETEYIEYFVKTNNKNNRNSYGSQGYSGSQNSPSNTNSERIVQATDYIGMEDVPVAVPNEISEEDIYPKQKRIQNKFEIKNNKVIFEKNDYSDRTNPKIIQKDIAIDASKTKIIPYYYSQTSKDTIQNFQNYLTYKEGSKTGIIFPSHLEKRVVFDSISTKISQINRNNEVFMNVIVGNKDENGQMKFGIYSNEKNIIVQPKYDEINFSQVQVSSVNSLFETKLENKIGFLMADGTVLSEPKFEEVKAISSQENYYQKIYQLKQGNQYGLIFKFKNDIIFVDTFSKYQIQDLLIQNPNQIFSKDTNNGILLKLVDENRKFVGYADTNGQLFFKD